MSTIYVAPKAEEEAPGSAEAAPSAEPTQEKPRIEYHEAANIFPMMPQPELQELAEDIKTNGLRERIWLHEGKIIDGRNRYEGCLIAGKEPEFRNWDGNGSLVTFVLSLNLHRRHLSTQQRAMIAGRAIKGFEVEAKDRSSSNLVQNTNAEKVILPTRGSSADRAATLVGVSASSAKKAAKVIKNGTPELIAAVDHDAVGLDDAAAVAALPKDEQREIVEQGRVKEAAKELQDAKKPPQEKVADKPSAPVKSPDLMSAKKTPQEKAEPSTPPVKSHVSSSKAVTDTFAAIQDYHEALAAAGKHKAAEARLITIAKSLRDEIEALRNPPSQAVDSAPRPAPIQVISPILRPLLTDKTPKKSTYDPVLGI